MTHHNPKIRSRHLKLCRMGNSLYVTVTAFARAHNLDQHDEVLCVPEPDGIKLKFTDREPSQPEAA